MKTCITCSSEVFTETRQWQVYCSKKCRDNAPKKRETTRAYQQGRRDILNAMKLETGCVRCGYQEHPAALDFNHIDGTKSFNVSQDPKRSWELLMTEIGKCEVLCANCHRIHTYEQRHWHTKRKEPINASV